MTVSRSVLHSVGKSVFGPVLMLGKRKVVVYGVLAIHLAIGFWLAGYVSFKSSSDWTEVQQALAESELVSSQVGSVKEVFLSPFDFHYRFSGSWAEARLNITAHGVSGIAEFNAELRKSSNGWKLVRLTES